MIPTATARAKTAAALTLAALALLTLAACASPEPQVIEREVVREVEVVKEVEVQVVVTATPVPQPTAAPTPVPTNTPLPSPTPETSRAAAAPTPAPIARRAPTAPPKPTPTPTLTIDDFYVIINQGPTSDGKGIAALYYDAHQIESGNGAEVHFRNEDFFINYLLKQDVITPEQRNAYYTPVSPERLDDYGKRMVEFFDEDFDGNTKVPMRPFANAVYRLSLLQDERGHLQEERVFAESTTKWIIDRYADISAVQADIAARSSSGGNTPPDETGYVVIRDGSIAVSGTSEDGVTTSVSIDTVDTGELLDYLLSQNKITVAQRDEYGRTGELELSLADTPDFFDWAISSDEGIQVGINEEGIDYIRNNILPLFGGE